jgi:hypothetical protein
MSMPTTLKRPTCTVVVLKNAAAYGGSKNCGPMLGSTAPRMPTRTMPAKAPHAPEITNAENRTLRTGMPASREASGLPPTKRR